MRKLISSLSLKTKLLIIMVSLCFLSIATLLTLYAMAEKELVDEVRHRTEELSAAIQISIEQMSDPDAPVDMEKLKELAHYKKKGIKEISIVDSDRMVIASSSPAAIGKQLNLKGESYRDIGNVTEYTTVQDGQKLYDMLLPVVVGREKLGYIHIETQFDDFKTITRRNHLTRLFATFSVFTIGILAAIYLSRRYIEPIQAIADAAQKVAGGDLSVRLAVQGGDETGRLTRNFNDMVAKLEENRALEEKLKAAEQLSRIGTLASGIAHEVRNPLNFINLSIDHLAATHGPADAQRRHEFLSTVEGIKSEITRLNGMVSNFLDFGKPMKLDIRPVALSPIIDETVSLVAERARGQRVAVEVAGGRGATAVKADYRHIKTCLLNVFINAIEAMPNGGRLTVEASPGPGSVSVRIADTGCGIAEESIRKIFDPYFTTKDTGIGLGLALTKRIIEEHGGAISVESAMDRGSAFIISLPAADAALA
ncbi:MAG: HAMP domain-containing protein [Deltaproteobacteria bacterium]|nr:HAMP domain-containing protein [Deltaproteobacteria bacterium]